MAKNPDDDLKICEWCDDSGFLVFTNGRRKECPACGGTGYATKAETDKAGFVCGRERHILETLIS